MKSKKLHFPTRILKQPSSHKSQQGWTLWSMLFVMAVMFTLAYIAMQLIPVYSSNQNVVNAMRQSVESKDLRTISRKQIVRGMQNQLYLDGDGDVIDYGKELKVERSRNKFVVTVAYEQEVPLVANLFLIARFNPTVECDLNGRCDP